MAERSEAATSAAPRVAVSPILPCILGLLLPGAGHFFLRRNGKALIFLGCLLALFSLGLLQDARLEVASVEDPLALLRGLAQMALGVPYLIARYLAGWGQGAVTAVTHEYGNTFTEVAGLLNVLVVIDAHDVAVGRKP
jgi:hypothetical protein